MTSVTVLLLAGVTLLTVANSLVSVQVSPLVVVLNIASTAVWVIITWRVIRDRNDVKQQAQTEAERNTIELLQERQTQDRYTEAGAQACADAQRKLEQERAVRVSTDVAYRLLSKAVPLVGALADVALDKTSTSSVALMDEIFTLNKETETLTGTITDSLSSVANGDTSMKSAMTDLRRDIRYLNSIREAQLQIESSMSESIATIGAKVSEAKRLLQEIENITEKTNVLAINAAVQAAKAGKHGRAFGVIAGEIHDLSTEAHEASASIAENTQGVRTSFAEFSQLYRRFVNSSGESLSAAVESIDETIDKLASATDRIGISVTNAASVSHDARERLERIIESMQAHDAVQQIVGHMHAILAESMAEADAIRIGHDFETGNLDLDQVLIAISGRHMTMKEEFEAVGNDEYDHSEGNDSPQPEGLVLEGSVTLF